MDIKSGHPFWAIRNGLLHEFPPLDRDLRCDVAVLGAGITGALIADELSRHGHEVCVLDQGEAGWGSTSASTALLQYEIDTHMTDLAKRHGDGDAVKAYRACLQAIDQLAARAQATGDVDFAFNESLYWASRRRDRKAMHEEFELRARHGFPVQWLDSAAIAERFGMQAPAAILSRKAARVDPYRLARRLLDALQANGVPVHDRSAPAAITTTSRSVALTTTRGLRVTCRHLVIATGYAAQRFLRQRVARNHSSYAFVTDPLPAERLGPWAQVMGWESARPYLYLRSTGDGRLLVGGEDDRLDIAAKRDAALPGKTRALVDKATHVLGGEPLEPAFSWAGTFAETADGLPFFGPHPEHGPRVLFAMAYGGNGITYSMIGGALLRAIIERRGHPLRELFGFQRIG